jgi:thiol-disulfide isomerase/thioredoxin
MAHASETIPSDPAPAETSGSRVDALGAAALLSYLAVGGVFVFGFAWALRPAVAIQNDSPCRPLRPEAREGAAVDFEVQDLEGNVVHLSDFAGKFVVLNFWATWCEPCITEWPQVNQLAERLADDDDIVVIAMSIEENRDDIYPFLERMAMARNLAPEGAVPQWELTTNVKVLWDPNHNVHTQYGTQQIPDTYFVDEHGQLVHAYINVRQWGSADALVCLDSVVGR